MSASCGRGTYQALGTYNQLTMGSGPVAPVPAAVPSSKYQVVPVFGALGYDSISRGNKGANGYAYICDAYQGCNQPTQYATRLCGSC